MAWDVTKPADADKIKDFPVLHRADKVTLRDEIQAEHATLGTGTGYHKIPVAAAPAPTGAEGRLAIVDDVLQFYSNAAWRKAGEPVSGIRQIFDQDAAPTGWTRDAVIDDKVPRIVTGARADGGSWTVAGLTGGDTGSTAISIAQMPAHTHGTFRRTAAGPWGTPGGATAVDVSTDSTGGGGGHVHSGSTISSDGTWRPLHRDMILCEKD